MKLRASRSLIQRNKESKMFRLGDKWPLAAVRMLDSLKDFFEVTRYQYCPNQCVYLGMDNPARYVAAFNKQSKVAKYLAAYAYAALEGSTILREKYPNVSLEIPMSRRHAHKTTLHQQCPRRGTPLCPPASLRYRTADGSCNNLREPWWGSAMSTMIRFLPPTYDDGIQNIRRSIHGHPLPSPRDISNFIHEDRDLPQATVTHMLMQWGQFVDHDIVDLELMSTSIHPEVRDVIRNATNVPYTTSEAMKAFRLWDPTIEIVGIAEKIEASRRVGAKNLLLFKFIINNGDGEHVQVTAWNDEVDRAEAVIKSKMVVHLEGAYAKPSKPQFPNKGTVHYELNIEPCTTINILGKVSYDTCIADGHEQTTSIAQTCQLVDVSKSNIFSQVDGFIKMNFVKVSPHGQTQTFGSGSITDGQYMLRIRIINFDEEEYAFQKGDHVRIKGYMRNTATAQNSGFNGTFPQCCLQNGAGPQPSELMHPDCLPIIVHQHDSFLGPLGVRCLEFVRSSPAPRENCQFGPREQLSQVTSFLDASMVYSSSTEHSDSLRLFRHGLLQYGKLQSRKSSLPLGDIDSFCQRGFVTTECFKAGDGRLSEQPALLSIHIVFLKLHNRIATKLAAINRHWSDEILYQEARRIVSALIQLVTYREYLPVLLGDGIIKIFDLQLTSDGYYNGYNDTVNPNIVNAFATAAYRFGHSLVQDSFIRVDMQHRPVFNNASIHNEFNNRENLHSAGSLDRLLLGLVNQPSQKRDEFIAAELTNHLFQTPSFKFGMDLASINIQRGRDHGLSPYIAWRSICGLSQIKNWDDFESVTSSSAAHKFQKVYSALEDVDLFSAGLAEKPVLGGLIGPTFACIIAQQFRNLRKGDRFWFENPNRENSFTIAQLQQIKKVTLARILCDTMENIETVQPFVFLTPDTLRNNRVPCDNQIIGNLNFHEWAETVVMPTNE